LEEVRRFAELIGGRRRNETTEALVTLGREVLDQAREAGLVNGLEASGTSLRSRRRVRRCSAPWTA
ncbi:MAG: hypothetical protein AAFU79_33740, partial [Myxococcota bacterium]